MTSESDAVQLVTFAVPGSSVQPMEVKVAHSGLRMVLASRESISLLNGNWKVLECVRDVLQEEQAAGEVLVLRRLDTAAQTVSALEERLREGQVMVPVRGRIARSHVSRVSRAAMCAD